jgi:enolase
MKYCITGIRATDILDLPARRLKVCVEVDGQFEGTSEVSAERSPSLLNGSEEPTQDLRERDSNAFGAARATIEREIGDVLRSRAWSSLTEIDAALQTVGGSLKRVRLGDTATRGVSMAAARACAARDGMPLYRWLPTRKGRCLPTPQLSLVRGGEAANNRLDFRDFMVVPRGAPSFREGLRAGVDVHDHLGQALRRMGFTGAMAEGGGFSPALQAPEDVLDLLTEAIRESRYSTGEAGMVIALDLVASRLRQPDGSYRVNGSIFDSIDFVEYLAYLVDRYPIWSIEGGMADDDPKGWKLLTERLGERVQLVGNEHLVAEPARASEAIEMGTGPAVLIEPGRLATVTDAMEVAKRSDQGGFGVLISDRLGQSTDPFISDLAVALGCGQIAVGTPTRVKGVPRFSRLEDIETESPQLPYGHSR